MCLIYIVINWKPSIPDQMTKNIDNVDCEMIHAYLSISTTKGIMLKKVDYNIWYDVMWSDMWCDAMWCDMIWYDMIWYDMKWYDMTWHDIWYNIIWHMLHVG